ncbi:hypothetical protein LTR17_015465 [Elasticomyces elasticus]|nr:hypothetical protein LTR17_015465 [Elasticomyces elasticus]
MASQSLPYEVRDSPGKGSGCFATEDIEAGTLIMKDARLMHVKKTEHRALTHAEVHQAFETLDHDQQSQFLLLHEGTRPYKSKVMRIYMNNTFRDKFDNYMLLEISKLNHSCTPNAERDPDVADKTIDQLLAVKDIAKGEEIYHSYYGDPFATTAKNRVKLLEVFYGFTCDCVACNADRSSRALSDMRRVLLEALILRIGGFGPADYSLIDCLTQENADVLQMCIGQPRTRLEGAMTQQEKVTYPILIGRLLEAEGCLCGNLAKFYARAGLALLRQIQAMGDLLIVDAFSALWYWLGEARRMSTAVRGAAAKCIQDVFSLWKEVETSPELERAMYIINQNAKDRSEGSSEEPIFAVVTEERGQGKGDRYLMLEKQHCLQLLRGKFTRAHLTSQADKEA